MSSIRRNKQEQKRICEDWQRSELSQTEYCRRNNIQFYALNRWIRNFRKANRSGIEIGQNNSDDSASTRTQNIKFLPIHNHNHDNSNNINPTRSYSYGNNHNKGTLEITLPNGINFKTHLSETRIEAYLQGLLK